MAVGTDATYVHCLSNSASLLNQRAMSLWPGRTELDPGFWR